MVLMESSVKVSSGKWQLVINKTFGAHYLVYNTKWYTFILGGCNANKVVNITRHKSSTVGKFVTICQLTVIFMFGECCEQVMCSTRPKARLTTSNRYNHIRTSRDVLFHVTSSNVLVRVQMDIDYVNGYRQQSSHLVWPGTPLFKANLLATVG